MSYTADHRAGKLDDRKAAVRGNDDIVAAEYSEVEPFRLRNVDSLQRHLARAQALVRIQRARLEEPCPRCAGAGEDEN